MVKEEDDAPRPRRTYELGQPLDLLSVHEIDETIAALRAEIARLESARAAKASASAAADAFFRR